MMNKETEELIFRNEFLEQEIERVKAVAKACANELCYKCGEYKREHLGACDGCPWKEVRHGTV